MRGEGERGGKGERKRRFEGIRIGEMREGRGTKGKGREGIGQEERGLEKGRKGEEGERDAGSSSSVFLSNNRKEEKINQEPENDF